MKRLSVILIVVVGIIGGFFALRANRLSNREESLASFQTELAATGQLTAMVGATGTVRANQSAILTFQTTGRVDTVHIVPGQMVEKGDVLAELAETSLPSQVILAQADLVAAQRALDDLWYSEQALAAAQQSLAVAEDALRDAEYMRSVRQEGNRASENTLDAARANLVLAQQEVDMAKHAYDSLSGRPDNDPGRALALSKLAAARKNRDSIRRNLNWYTGHPTESEQALLDADLAVAEAQLADAQREWERLKDGPDPADIKVAEARIAAAEATLELARITAPFSGMITSVEVKAGDQVGPGTIGFGLSDLSHLLVDMEISEVDINRIQPAQQVTLNFDAVLDRNYQGEVIEIGLEGIVVQGVVTFKVTVELMDPDEAIKPGMTAAVNIIVENIENVLLVPNRAVRVQDGDRIVYILKDGALEPVPILLGVSSESYSEVVEGDLKVGDAIVLNPPMVFDTNGPPTFMRR